MPRASAVVYANEDAVDAALQRFRAELAGQSVDIDVKIEFVNEPGNLVVSAGSEPLLQLLLQHLARDGMRSRPFVVTPHNTSMTTTALWWLLILGALGGTTYVAWASDDVLAPNTSIRQRIDRLAFEVPVFLWLVWIGAALVGFAKLVFYGGALPPAAPHAPSGAAAKKTH